MELGKAPYAAALVFKELAAAVSHYGEMSYRSLSRTVEQWPIIGRDDLYYGGTSYNNNSGIGQQWVSTGGGSFDLPVMEDVKADGLQLIHVPSTYSSGTLIDKSELISGRVIPPTLHLHADDAGVIAVSSGDVVNVAAGEHTVSATVSVNGKTPAGLGLLQGTPFMPGTFSAAINKVAAAAAGD
jgi:NADH-quinone oxidoreductase subunit G